MKSKLCLLSLTVGLFLTSMTTNAALGFSNRPPETTEQIESRLTEIKQRIEEIRTMDKSQLSKRERKNLRNELKDMKKELKARDRGGIYISTGAIIAAIVLVALILVLVLK